MEQVPTYRGSAEITTEDYDADDEYECALPVNPYLQLARATDLRMAAILLGAFVLQVVACIAGRM